MGIRNVTLNTTPTSAFRSIGGASAITSVYLCNKSTGVVRFSLYAISGNDESHAGPANIIYYDVQVAPTDTYVLDNERLILDDGDTLAGKASTEDSIVVTVSYTRI